MNDPKDSRAGRRMACALGLVAVAAAGVAASAVNVDDDHVELLEKARRLFPPLPKDAGTAEHPITPGRARLGRMPAAVREQAVEMLDARLADGVDPQTQVKQAHWYVEGPDSIALHELSDKMSDSVRE